MGENDITILFRGICTHFSKSAVPELPVPHRVVIPDTIDPPWIANGRLVPHLAFLYFSPAVNGLCVMDDSPFFSGYPLMNGLRLSVDVPEGEVKLTNWADLPKLTYFRPDYLPDPYVILNGKAACYFDVPAGEIEAIRMELGEYYTKLTIRNAAKREITVEGLPEPLSIPEGHCVIVRHLALPAGTHSNEDFRLHYLTARGGIPRYFNHPLPGQAGYKAVHRPKSGALYDDLMTPACSNSGYP